MFRARRSARRRCSACGASAASFCCQCGTRQVYPRWKNMTPRRLVRLNICANCGTYLDLAWQSQASQNGFDRRLCPHCKLKPAETKTETQEGSVSYRFLVPDILRAAIQAISDLIDNPPNKGSPGAGQGFWGRVRANQDKRRQFKIQKLIRQKEILERRRDDYSQKWKSDRRLNPNAIASDTGVSSPHLLDH